MLLITMTVLMLLGSTFGILAKRTYENSYAKMALSQAKLTATTTLNVLDKVLETDIELRNKLITNLDQVIANNSFVYPTQMEAHQFILRIPVRYFVETTAINQDGANVSNIDDQRLRSLLASDKFGESYIEVSYTNKSKSEIRFRIVGQYKGYISTISYLYSRSTNATKELEKILSNSLILKTPIVNVITHEIKGDMYIDNPRDFKIEGGVAVEINEDKFENIFSGKYDVKSQQDVPDDSSTKGHTKKKDFFDRVIDRPNKWTEVYIRRVFYDQHAERYPSIYGELKEVFPSYSKFDQQLVNIGDIKNFFYRTINGNLIINSDALVGLYDKGGTVFKYSLDYVERRYTENSYSDDRPGASEHGYGKATGVTFDYRTLAEILGGAPTSVGQNVHNTYLGLKGDLYINGNARIENIRQKGNQYITGSAVIAGPRDYKADNKTFTHWFNVIDGDVYIDGNAYIENTIITGNLYVNGKICEIQQSQVGGNVYVTNTSREDIIPYTVLTGNPNNANELGIITSGKIEDATPGRQNWNNNGRKYIVKDDYYYTHNLGNVNRQLSDINGTPFTVATKSNPNINTINRKYSNDTPVTNIKYNVKIGGSVKVNTSLILNLSSDIHGDIIANPIKNEIVDGEIVQVPLQDENSFLFINAGPYDSINGKALFYNNYHNTFFTIFGDIKTTAQQVHLSQFYLSNSTNKKISAITGATEIQTSQGSIIQNNVSSLKSYLILNSVKHTISVKQGDVITKASRVIVNSIDNDDKTGIKASLVPTTSVGRVSNISTTIRGSLIADNLKPINTAQLNISQFNGYSVDIENDTIIEGNLYVKPENFLDAGNIYVWLRGSRVYGDIKIDGNIQIDALRASDNISINGDLHASGSINFVSSQASFDIGGNIYSGKDLSLSNAKVMTRKNDASFAIKSKGKISLNKVTSFYGNIIAYDRIVSVGSTFRNGKVVSFNDSVILSVDDSDKTQSVLIRYLDDDGAVLNSMNAYTSTITLSGNNKYTKITVTKPDFTPYRKNKAFKGWVLASARAEYKKEDSNFNNNTFIGASFSDYNALGNLAVNYPYVYGDGKTHPYVVSDESKKVYSLTKQYLPVNGYYGLIYNLTYDKQTKKPHIFDFQNDVVLCNSDDDIEDLTFLPYFEDEKVNDSLTERVVADVEIDYKQYHDYAQTSSTQLDFIQKLNVDKIFPEYISILMDSSLEKTVKVRWNINNIDYKKLRSDVKYEFYPTKEDGTSLFDNESNNKIVAKVLFRNVNTKSRIVYKDEYGSIIASQYFLTGSNPTEPLYLYKNGQKMFRHWYKEGDIEQREILTTDILTDITLQAKVANYVENNNYQKLSCNNGGYEDGGSKFYFKLQGDTDLLFPVFTAQEVLDASGNPIVPTEIQLLKNDFELGNLYLKNTITESEIKAQLPERLTFKYKDGTLKIINLDSTKWQFAQPFNSSIITKQRVYYNDSSMFSSLENGLLMPHYNIYLINESSPQYDKFVNVVIKDKNQKRSGIFIHELNGSNIVTYAQDTYEGIDTQGADLYSKKLTIEYVFVPQNDVLPEIKYYDTSNNLVPLTFEKLNADKNGFSEVYATYKTTSYLSYIGQNSLFKGEEHSQLSALIFPQTLYLEMSNHEIVKIENIGISGNYPKLNIINGPYDNNVVNDYEFQLQNDDGTLYKIFGNEVTVNLKICIVNISVHNLTLNIMHTNEYDINNANIKIIGKYAVNRTYSDFKLDGQILDYFKLLFRFGLKFDKKFYYYNNFDNVITAETYEYDFLKTFKENSETSFSIDVRTLQDKYSLYLYPKFESYAPNSLENNIIDNVTIKAVNSAVIGKFIEEPKDININNLMGGNTNFIAINLARYAVHSKMFPFTQRFIIKMNNGESVYLNLYDNTLENNGMPVFNNELLEHLNSFKKYVVDSVRADGSHAPQQFNFKFQDDYKDNLKLVIDLENQEVSLETLKDFADPLISKVNKAIMLLHPDEKENYLSINEIYAKEHLIIGLPLTSTFTIHNLSTMNLDDTKEQIKTIFSSSEIMSLLPSIKKYFLQKIVAGKSLFVNNAYFDLGGINQKVYAHDDILISNSIINTDVESGKFDIPNDGQYPITIINSRINGTILVKHDANIKAQHGGNTVINDIKINKESGTLKIEGPVKFSNPVYVKNTSYVVNITKPDGAINLDENNFGYAAKFNGLYVKGTLIMSDYSAIETLSSDNISYVKRFSILRDPNSSGDMINIRIPLKIDEFLNNGNKTTINIHSDFYNMNSLSTLGTPSSYSSRFNVLGGKIFYIAGNYATSLDRFIDDGTSESILYVNGSVNFKAVNDGWQYAKLSRALIATGDVRIDRKYGVVLKKPFEFNLHPDIITLGELIIDSNGVNTLAGNTSETDHDYFGALFAKNGVKIHLNFTSAGYQPIFSLKGVYTEGDLEIYNSYYHLTNWDRPFAVSNYNGENNTPYIYAKTAKIKSPENGDSSNSYSNRIYFSDSLKVYLKTSLLELHKVYKGGKNFAHSGNIITPTEALKEQNVSNLYQKFLDTDDNIRQISKKRIRDFYENNVIKSDIDAKLNALDAYCNTKFNDNSLDPIFSGGDSSANELNNLAINLFGVAFTGTITQELLEENVKQAINDKLDENNINNETLKIDSAFYAMDLKNIFISDIYTTLDRGFGQFNSQMNKFWKSKMTNIKPWQPFDKTTMTAYNNWNDIPKYLYSGVENGNHRVIETDSRITERLIVPDNGELYLRTTNGNLNILIENGITLGVNAKIVLMGGRFAFMHIKPYSDNKYDLPNMRNPEFVVSERANVGMIKMDPLGQDLVGTDSLFIISNGPATMKIEEGNTGTFTDISSIPQTQIKAYVYLPNGYMYFKGNHKLVLRGSYCVGTYLLNGDLVKLSSFFANLFNVNDHDYAIMFTYKNLIYKWEKVPIVTAEDEEIQLGNDNIEFNNAHKASWNFMGYE